MEKTYTLTVEKLPHSQVELIGSIPWIELASTEPEALKRLGTSIQVDGFRKGAVPEAVLRKQIPEQLLLEEMAELLLQEYYPLMLEREKIDAIGRPKIALTKLARENPFEFRIITAVMPEVALPDYKKLATTAEKEPIAPVTDEEVEKAIQELRHLRFHQDAGHDHSHTGPHEHPEEELPAVDDTFAQSFGKFKTLDELKAKIRENTTQEKMIQSRDKRRTHLLEIIAAETIVEIPKLFVDAELEKLMSQFSYDISQAGMDFDTYLSQAGKTKEELALELTPDAEKRAKFQLIIDSIARTENITPAEETIVAEAEKLLQAYPGADVARTRAYAELMLTNDAVLSRLENL